MPDSPSDDLPAGPLLIPASELSWRTSRSSGPGGQHANTSDTKVELRWSPATSGVVSEWQRGRLVAKLGDEVSVIAQDERSQARNRALARRRLAEKVAEALVVLPPRRATRPTRGSVERRLAAKRRVGDRKAGRRTLGEPDD